MSKIIIDNQSEETDAEALYLVMKVIDEGMVSNGTYGKQYCFMSVFEIKRSDKIANVYCDKRKSGTFKFIVRTMKG